MAWLAALAEPSVLACVVLTVVSATVTAITLLAPQWCCKRLGGLGGDVPLDGDADGGENGAGGEAGAADGEWPASSLLGGSGVDFGKLADVRVSHTPGGGAAGRDGPLPAAHARLSLASARSGPPATRAAAAWRKGGDQ